MITIEQMVQREVLCCMSSLVSTLAEAYSCGLGGELFQQASELVAPVLDYEEAATQAGWRKDVTWYKPDADPNSAESETFTTLESLYNSQSIDPYEWEVCEHWAVSQWLADKLQVQGERVDTDFAGLNIWARTTTGQAISMDGCIQLIYADMMAPHTLDSVAPGA